MDMLPSSEQQQILDSVREFFASEFPLQRLQSCTDTPETMTDAQWRSIGELGYFGLGIAEEQGGSGYSLAEEMLLLREAGRCLMSPALTAQILGTHVAQLAGIDPQPFATGHERIALLAPIGAAQIGTVTRGEFHSVDAVGAAGFVTWNDASAALVPAHAVNDRSAVRCLDDAVALERVRLVDVPARAFVASAQSSVRWRAVLYIAAQLVGIAEATRDMAVEYAKTRTQFGQPIGAFQAIKHSCADMAMRCEAAWSQTLFAGLSLQGQAAAAPQLAAAAALLASRAAQENAAANIQIHGGMGYTAECGAHRFVKRARVLERLLGPMQQYSTATLNTDASAPSLQHACSSTVSTLEVNK